MSISAFLSGVISTPATIAEAAAVIAMETPGSPEASALNSTAPLSLGEIHFDGFAAPEGVKVGTKQALTVHKLLGGGRVVDANGADYETISWGGLLFGEDAEARATALQTMCDEGHKRTLAWGAFNYDVVIETFGYDYSSAFQIRYSIGCVVLQVNPAIPSSPSLSQITASDLAEATRASPDGLPDLTGIMRGVRTLRAGVDQATAIYDRVMSVRGRIQSAIARGNVIISGLQQIGSGSPSATIRALNDAASGMETLARMGSTNALLGRVLHNLGR